MSETLYERLGGSDGIQAIANDLIDLHAANPRIAKRYADSDLAAVKVTAAEFFITGTGGPNVYKGKDMIAAHKGMNIDAAEFMAVLDDVVDALEKNNIGQREKEEVLFIFYSMRREVMFQ